MRKINKGFTLIELIITIVVVGVLAGVAIAGYQAVTSEAEDAAIEATADSFQREMRALMAFGLSADAAYTAASADLSGHTPSVTDVAGDAEVVEATDTITITNDSNSDSATFTVGSSYSVDWPATAD